MRQIRVSEETLLALREHDEGARNALARGLAIKDKTLVKYTWSRDGFVVYPNSINYPVRRYSNPIF